MSTTKIYKLPPTFTLDHIGRDLLDYENVVGKSGRNIIVRLNNDEYSELKSDAEFYLSMGSGSHGFGAEHFGLVRSAAATLKALHLAGCPHEEEDV
jgi:hypothetical protein